MNRLIVLLGAGVIAMGCAAERSVVQQPSAATQGTDASPHPILLRPGEGQPPQINERRQNAVQLARNFLGHSRLRVGRRLYPNDCTGLVRAVYDQLGINLLQEGRPSDSGVSAIHRFVGLHGQLFSSRPPLPGDLVFFRETYDRNGDGRRNDGLTHVGLVERVDEDGTVIVIHRVRRGVVRYHMNLGQPMVHTDPQSGRILNDYLRFARAGQKDVLTGQLFAQFGSVLKPALALR